ncbi:MAG: family transporter protein [Chitinophagaceae bacterium]|nr:family transporter protein [Chitinophagaceae bacterium]
MFELIKIEWMKIRKYSAFWWMLGIVALSYPAINYLFYNIYLNIISHKGTTGALAKALIGNPFSFPETWHSVAYFSSYFIMIPSILVIMLMTNEYQFKTLRQNIIDGWSKNQFMTAKLCDVIIITFIVTLAYSTIALVFGFTVSEDTSGWSNQLQYIPLFMLQTFAQLSIAFLLGFMVRKAFIALGIFIFYYLIVENIGVNYFKFKQHDEGKFLPFELSDRLIPYPKFLGKIDTAAYDKSLNAINEHIVYTLVLTALIWWLCYYLNKKRDL